MASATPHDGKPASFASLMNMLNPTAIANPKIRAGGHQGPVPAPLQEGHPGSGRRLFHGTRRSASIAVPASPEEEAVYDLLAGARFRSFDQTAAPASSFSDGPGKVPLLHPGGLPADHSPAPAKDRKGDRPGCRPGPRHAGAASRKLWKRIDPSNFTKYQRLLEILNPGGKLEWDPDNPADRLVIFTERIETVRFLEENLARDLKLKAGRSPLSMVPASRMSTCSRSSRTSAATAPRCAC